MREAIQSISSAAVFFCALSGCFLSGQTLTPSFQFSGPAKPGDPLTITGTDLAGITTVTLKSTAGKPDLTATSPHATAASVTFTVPATASGAYTVVLSPGSIAPIPLTVNPPTSAANTPVTTPAPPPVSRIYMPDGQLQSHSIRVYVTPDIPPGQDPKLLLLRSHAITPKEASEATPFTPFLVATNQQWTESGKDQPTTMAMGTLLLFDLSNIDFKFKPMIRVLPVICSGNKSIADCMQGVEAGKIVDPIAVGTQEVNIGDIVAVVAWTLVVVGFAVLLVFGLSWRKGTSPLLLFAGVDGHLSLAQTQVACWTVVIGGVVLGYGMVKLDIPVIPESLLALMGASLATGGIGFFKDAQNQQAAVSAGAAISKRDLAFGDLVRVFPAAGGEPQLSLAKAQMLFWTVLLVVLFVSKSILDGAIWDIPWALVALMGFSQAGYLAPKLAPQNSPAQAQAVQQPPPHG